jgi:LuxR family maltose regulon positive regulatory protein
LMHRGLTNDEIAERLDLRHGTVRNYTASIYRKMNVRNRTEAVNCAVDLGLIEF